MVLLLEYPELDQHYRDSLQRYVKEHPGQIVRLEVVDLKNAPFRVGNVGIRETFQGELEYQQERARNVDARTEFLRMTRPEHIQFGGVIGNSLVAKIPKEMPVETRIFDGAGKEIDLREMFR